MSKTVAEYVRDLLQELDDIAAFTVEGRDAFMSDVKTQKAVIRSYEVVGEICKRLPEALREGNPQIDWRKLITFRDFLAHNYDLIGLRYVWEAVADLSQLRAAFEALLGSLQDGEEQTE